MKREKRDKGEKKKKKRRVMEFSLIKLPETLRNTAATFPFPVKEEMKRPLR